jgi:hypothetical protein
VSRVWPNALMDSKGSVKAGEGRSTGGESAAGRDFRDSQVIRSNPPTLYANGLLWSTQRDRYRLGTDLDRSYPPRDRPLHNHKSNVTQKRNHHVDAGPHF